MLPTPLQKIKPKNARSKRALEKKEPHITENPKTTLFLRGTSCSQICQLALADLHTMKNPLAIKFSKKNEIHPFDDPSSLEFFSEKNDASLMVFGHHSKKRPHCLTVVRMFNWKVLDMLELYIDPESFRTLSQFKNEKCAVGLKPLLAFSGTPFESPVANQYTLAKSFFADLFRGHDTQSVDVEGLQYMIHFSVEEEVDGKPAPQIHMRVYKILTKRSGQKLPRVEVEEMGPRMDFRVGRTKEADEAVMKEALKRPKQLEPKTKKNIETDIIGDKIGRIHLGKQDLGQLQTRKMKGLKRRRGEDGEDAETMVDEEVDEDLEPDAMPKHQRL
ncbi:Brix-domain-containing protein [Saccharata proteae CBS 121410]|uniref:Ribosome production factor 2 homolog n=1 Tax=Saccharata proteae CBS 121410 TaxID=1314787 RepID=A0A9P4HWP7_9PEZI|nr:Brix-domain-containing protein [Saccharata proteae CBS 121410]